METTTEEAAKRIQCPLCEHVGALMQVPNVLGVAPAHEIEPFPVGYVQVHYRKTNWKTRARERRAVLAAEAN